MLQSRKIDFKHHDLLTVQMLYNMQQSTMDAAIAPYLSYADGIISGLTVSMDELSQLRIAPGAVKWQGNMYIMTQEYVSHALPANCLQGWLIAVPQNEQFSSVFVDELPEVAHIVLAAFSKRDPGSVLKQVDELKKLQFFNYFNASAVRIAGADGQLTYNDTIAQCFAKELLGAPGAEANDRAFAWQAMQQPPTKTMWTYYLQQNDAVWTDDSERFVAQLQQILIKKQQPIVQRIVPTANEVKPEIEVNSGLIVD